MTLELTTWDPCQRGGRRCALQEGCESAGVLLEVVSGALQTPRDSAGRVNSAQPKGGRVLQSVGAGLWHINQGGESSAPISSRV